ncbi:hypothetical protein Lfu02_75970 [Longispora fulva]|nr:hypothetical protein Lfu02_75970 [Longispora fulva]
MIARHTRHLAPAGHTWRAGPAGTGTSHPPSVPVVGLGDLVVAAHFDALIPGQRPRHVGRQSGHRLGEDVAEVLGGLSMGYVQQLQEPGRAFDQCSDGRPSVSTT